MTISSNPNNNAVSFRAVNQKYLKWAADDYKNCSCITANWMHQFGDDVFLFEDISKQDAIDTLAAVRKYVTKDSFNVFDEFFEGLYI